MNHRISACSTGSKQQQQLQQLPTPTPRCVFAVRSPYGAWLSIARRWGEPVRGADRRSAPYLQHKDVL